ncbi:Uncharacterised protein [Mycobacteroides abscessus subsp. abscessus]|nr:Uncharacterised protein [Mycobacteroides abscessus subsp. abscessus]
MRTPSDRCTCSPSRDTNSSPGLAATRPLPLRGATVRTDESRCDLKYLRANRTTRSCSMFPATASTIRSGRYRRTWNECSCARVIAEIDSELPSTLRPIG